MDLRAIGLCVLIIAISVVTSKHHSKDDKTSHHQHSKKHDAVKHHITKPHHVKKSAKLHHSVKHNHKQHKLQLKHHKHQSKLHLKAHKKGVTYAKPPAEPQACIDFLPCLQYRYYHCRSHEWIRNNCPKLCLYCEHQPFPEPTYGRFKPVMSAYPDWCLDHSQCVAFPTEACAYDEWMKLNCLRKCDSCYQHRKVKAGLLFVGHPFNVTPKQQDEEEQLNDILHFRPTSDAKKFKKLKKVNAFGASADQQNKNSKATTAADTTAKPILPGNPVLPGKPVLPEGSPGKPVLPEKPVYPVLSTQNPAASSPGKPVLPEKPVYPVLSTQNPAAPASPVSDKPIAPPPVGPAFNQPPPVTPGKVVAESKPALVSPPEQHRAQQGALGGHSNQDLVKQELEAVQDSAPAKQFKADVLKDVQIKLKSGKFGQINTDKVYVKHEVAKPKRKHLVESLSAQKHKVSKPKAKAGAKMKHKDAKVKVSRKKVPEKKLGGDKKTKKISKHSKTSGKSYHIVKHSEKVKQYKATEIF